MSLAERRWLRLGTLALLFFAQGLPWGFMAITLYGYLAERGADAGTLANILAVTTLPFAFKWVWGPLVDAFALPGLGRRRPWILGAQLMMAATLALLLVIGDLGAQVQLLLGLCLVHTVFNALQNVAVDGLAIDLLEPGERGKASGLMYGAKYLGGAAGSAGIGTVIAHWGMRAGILILVAALLVITLVPFLVHERRATEAPPRTPLREILREIPRAFGTRSALVAALVMTWMNLAVGMINPVAGVLFLQHLGWQQEEYSQILGGPGLVIGFLGSITAGLLADWIGRRRLAALACAVMAGGWIVFALNEPLWTNRTFVYVLFVIEPLTNSVLTVSLWALCMDTSDKKVAATQFAAYTSLTNLSTVLGAKLLGAYATDWWTFQGAYLVAAGLQLAILAYLPFVKTRRES